MGLPLSGGPDDDISNFLSRELINQHSDKANQSKKKKTLEDLQASLDLGAEEGEKFLKDYGKMTSDDQAAEDSNQEPFEFYFPPPKAPYQGDPIPLPYHGDEQKDIE
jgi:hypothetical protein